MISPQIRIIAHLDMDAFFAAIEERDNPQFRGLPLVVGADPKEGRGRGVVSTANYKAREYGIRSAMPISTAWQLSQAAKRQGRPGVIFFPGNYRRVSQRIMALVRTVSPTVQVRSIDEAYFDVSLTDSYEKAVEICQDLKKKIHVQEKLTASVGIGPNNLIAKIASDYQKPDGLTVVKEENVEDFLAPLPVRVIPGIGPKTEAFLLQQGIRAINDARRLTKRQLQDMVGRWGLELYEKFRGRSTSPIIEHEEVKSVSEQTTFEADTLDPQFIFARLNSLCKNICKRLKEEHFTTFRTVTVTVRFADFETHTHAHTLPKPAYSLTTLQQDAVKLLLSYLDARKNPKHKLIRLIGVRVQKLK